MRRFLARLMSLFGSERVERDLSREIEAHLALMQDDFERRGLSQAEARAAARRSYGNVAQTKELHREERSFVSVEQFFADLRYGARNLLRTPAFTGFAVLTLALGIGANTAIFSVVNAVLIQPLDYREAHRLVTLLHDGSSPVSPANYVDWREQSGSFETMAAAESWSPNLTGTDTPEHIRGLRVTQNLLPMLGVAPLLGQVFADGDDKPGADRKVLLSHGLWQRRFGGRREILGTSITLNGEAFTVAGVMPASFKFAPFWATHAELWAPLALSDRIQSRGGNSLRVFARLKPGVTLAQARADVATVTKRLEQQYPGTNRGVVVTPLKENVVGKIETPLLMILGAVGFVLLIACANVAHMLLARTSDRQKEIAVRTALGASRSRVLRQFFAENLLLASLGAVGGLLLAFWGTKTLILLSPASLPRVESISLDGRVLLFLLGITALTSLLFGLAPAMRSASGNVSSALKEGGRGDTDGVRRNHLRNLLVASEFALAFMLLVGAGLTIRSFAALQSSDPGFDPENVVSMVVSVAGSKQAEPQRREIFYRELLQQVRTLPGVSAASGINHLPLAGDLWGWPFAIEGRAKSRPGEAPTAAYRIAMPDYFETMRFTLRRGRFFTERDDSRAPGVAVVNDRAANVYWPGEDPIGKRISFDAETSSSPTWLTVVGVVKDAKQLDWAANPYPEVYLAALQHRDFLGNGAPHISYITLVARTNGEPADAISAVKNTVWSIDRNLPISQVVTMKQVVADATAQPRFEMMLLGVFALVALLLAAVGIYGVISYSVARRTREIGIRMSLGASRTQVLRMVIRQGLAHALTGSLAGLAGALLLSRLMTKMLYGITPQDPLTFGVVLVVLSGAAMLAVCLPARRATKIEPMVALRSE